MSRTYLLTHPDKLKQAIQHCHEPGIQTSEERANCDIAMSAADTFIKLLNEQQHDPEGFGARVMDAQLVSAGKKTILESTQQHLAELLAQDAAPDKVVEATTAVNKANAEYIESENQVAILLAVIGVNSPE